MALPDTATLLATPRRSGNHLTTMTLTTGLEIPGVPQREYQTVNREHLPRISDHAHQTDAHGAHRRTRSHDPAQVVTVRQPAHEGSASAETTMYAVIPNDRTDRLHSRSSPMGFSMSPRAERDPPLKKRIANPVLRIIQR